MPDFTPFNQYRLYDFEHWVLFLHKGQHFLGRCYLALKRDGAIDIFADTTSEERLELQQAVAAVKGVMAELFNPDKYDYAALANEWPHCHLYVIPRYQGERQFAGATFVDTCWGRNYALYDRSATFPDELLFHIRDVLRQTLIAHLGSDESRRHD